jgi:hypothetical protein
MPKRLFVNLKGGLGLWIIGLAVMLGFHSHAVAALVRIAKHLKAKGYLD